MVGVVAITGIAIGVTALGWTMTKRINFVRNYWKTCKSETLGTAHGVECSTWLVPAATTANYSDDSDASTTATATTTAGATNTATATWFRVNDVIMGGKSTSELSTDDENGRLVFSGIISTDGGGFCSMRTTEECADRIRVPPNATAVRVVLRGDGQLWKVSLGTSHSLMSRDPTWSHDVSTSNEDKLTTAILPLADFTATRQGQPVAGAVLGDPSKIRSVGLILSLYTQTGAPNPRFGDGPFRVVLHELEFV
mmetsp:Transcript_11487/g.24243  ORF Transcript_11487/g.24243 Transcript_11487/m.24243 type:complete len:253 (-) Transcript_11487:321-1079(-)